MTGGAPERAIAPPVSGREAVMAIGDPGLGERRSVRRDPR